MLKKKIGRLSAIALSVALVITVFAGCGNSGSTSSSTTTTPSAPQIVKYNLGAEPKTIDPALNDAVDGATVIVNAFQGLTDLDSKQNAIPGVAEKWEVTPDGMKYTFHLNKKAIWSDGQPVKAGDFEYAWKRALNPDTASDYAYQLYYVKNAEAYNNKKAKVEDVGVKAIDDYTLEVNMEYPTAYFLPLVSSPTYMPVRKDVVEKNPKDWTLNGATYISNGAYKLKEWKPKDKMVFVKNDKFINASQTKLAEIDYSFLDNATSYLAAFQTGQLDFIDAPPTEQVPTLIKNGTAKVVPYLGTYYLEFNISPKAVAVDPKIAKALSDVKVREALNLAIDRQAIVDNVTKGGQLPATAMVPKGIPEDKSGKDFRSKDYFPAKGDVAKAKQLLSDAGYPDGKGFPKLVYLYNTNQGHQAVAQAVQDMWKKNLGIDVELSNQEWAVFQKTRTDKNYEVARGGWIADYNDPMTFLDLFTSASGNNDPGYNSTDFDAKVKAAKAENDVKKRMKLLHDAEDTLMTDQPIAPIYFYTEIACIKPYFKGVFVTSLGYTYLTHAYVQK